MRPDLINRQECACEPDHSITKLGHCADCPYYGFTNAQPLDAQSRFRRCASIAVAQQRQPPSNTIFVCGRDTHDDGTEHDFNWATYVDETKSYGVCYCGLDSMSHSMWE